jgi:hypothetical protein
VVSQVLVTGGTGTLGRVLRAFAAGSNLPGPGTDVGSRTFDAWLVEQRD